jgi:hypothetical protein
VEVEVVAEGAHDHAAVRVDAEDQQRRVEQAHDGVVADEQHGPVARHVAEAVEPGRGEPRPGREDGARRRELDGPWGCPGCGGHRARSATVIDEA